MSLLKFFFKIKKFEVLAFLKNFIFDFVFIWLQNQ